MMKNLTKNGAFFDHFLEVKQLENLKILDLDKFFHDQTEIANDINP